MALRTNLYTLRAVITHYRTWLCTLSTKKSCWGQLHGNYFLFEYLFNITNTITHIFTHLQPSKIPTTQILKIAFQFPAKNIHNPDQCTDKHKSYIKFIKKYKIQHHHVAFDSAQLSTRWRITRQSHHSINFRFLMERFSDFQ